MYALVIIAKLKGKAWNHDALSFHVGMYLCMYIRNACTIQSYARECISVMLAQLLHKLVAQMCPRGRLRPQTTAWPAWPVSFLWRNTLTSVSSLSHTHWASRMISLMLWRYTLILAVCCPLNDLIAGLSRAVCQMASRAKVALVLTAISHAEWHASFKASTPPVVWW